MAKLHNRNGIWYVRKHIPEPVRAAFNGRREEWRSLATRDPKEAEKRSHAVLARISHEIDEARKRPALGQMAAERMASAKADSVLDRLSTVAQQLGLPVPSFAPVIRTQEDEDFVELALQYQLGQVSERPKSAEQAVRLVDRALEQLEREREHGVHLIRGVDEDGNAHPVVPARYLEGLKAWLDEQFDATRRTLEAIRVELLAIGSGEEDVAEQAEAAPGPVGKGATLLTLLETWRGQRKPAEKTVVEAKTAVRRFEAIAGPLPYRDITVEHVRRYKAALIGDSEMKSATKAKQWAMVRTLLTVAKEDGLIANNPFDTVKLGKLPDDAEARDDFNQVDLTKIFGHLKGDEWWLARIALYTGARLGELCQLTGADVVDEEGVPSFSIRADVEAGKTVKTRNSIRKVPVHQQLLADGFEEWVATKGDGSLFPWASPVASKRLLRRFGEIGMGEGKVVHSFRHTFISAARKAMSEEEREWLVGHRSQKVGRMYGSYPNLKAKMDLVSFGTEHD